MFPENFFATLMVKALDGVDKSLSARTIITIMIMLMNFKIIKCHTLLSLEKLQILTHVQIY